MKEKIKIIFTLFLLTFVLIFPLITNARSGCCSHHGGVCGCGCCDGTSLSATCAPYYPQCNTKSVPATPNYNSPTPKEKPPTSQKYTAEIPKENNGGSIWWWVIGIGFGSYILYNFIKKEK